MTSPPSPVGAPERLVHLDVVRAVALFGVLVVNLLTEFRVSLFTQFFDDYGATAPVDRAIEQVVFVGIESKAFIVFSFLFGVGLAIQFERASARGAAFAPRAARRLGALLALGLVHLFLVWNGDILTLYAVCGIAMAPLLRLPRPALLAVAIVLFVLHVSPLPMPHAFPSDEAMRAHIEESTRVYASGSFADVLAMRVHEAPAMIALDVGALPRTLGLFALGAWAHRGGIVARPEAHLRLLAWTAAAGLLVGAVGLSAARADLGLLSDVGSGFGDIALGLSYAALLVLALRTATGRRLLSPLAPMGRMALTCYLGQSVVFGLVFYGYGFGRFGAMSATRAALLGVAVYLLQAAASAAWLSRFRFGPVEWLWRSVTYAAWQPLRVAPR